LDADRFLLVMQDTVIDAGYYDGALGILTAIAAVKVLNREGKSHLFPHPIEVCLWHHHCC
jgi:hypothetical protein